MPGFFHVLYDLAMVEVFRLLHRVHPDFYNSLHIRFISCHLILYPKIPRFQHLGAFLKLHRSSFQSSGIKTKPLGKPLGNLSPFQGFFFITAEVREPMLLILDVMMISFTYLQIEVAGATGTFFFMIRRAGRDLTILITVMTLGRATAKIRRIGLHSCTIIYIYIS